MYMFVIDTIIEFKFFDLMPVPMLCVIFCCNCLFLIGD